MWPVSRVLDYRLQVQFPAGLPLSATLHSLSHMVDLITSNIIWCQRNLGGEQSRHATYWFPCPWSCSFGWWCLAEGRISDQRRLIGQVARERLNFLLPVSYFHRYAYLSAVFIYLSTSAI